MDRLWSPWRSEYIASAGDADLTVCVFCKLRDEPENDAANFVLHRASHNFVVLNRYPYISGHLLIVPYEHVGELDAAAKPTTDELMDLTKRSQTALRVVYRPDGFNLGMNLGRAAGAGIADHIHIHILPRWSGDTNFMTAVAEARVLPEDLATTYQKLHDRF
ncbi:MAG: adenylyltransferase [Pyrinomonadaceae bacterium]|nr:adenylyltransferase [Pyrinomonadaceae bacterium]